MSTLFDVPGPVARRRMVWVNIAATVVVAGIGVWVLLAARRQGPARPRRSGRRSSRRARGTNYLIPGLIDTLKAAGISIVTAGVFGFVFGLGRLSALAGRPRRSAARSSSSSAPSPCCS